MAVTQLGILDLSAVTDRLLGLIDSAATSPLWPGGTPTGAAPHTVTDDGDKRISLYLFHVAQDPYQLNVPLNKPYQLDPRPLTAAGAVPQPPPAAYRIPFLPLSLDLYYLLTAYGGDDFRWEQQAMSVAMTCLHENPFVSTVGVDGQTLELTVTMAVQSADELSRLWQATTAPLRLSAVYKVSAVFLAGEPLGDVEAAGVTRVVTVADAVDLPLDPLGDVSGTSLETSYTLPDGTVRPYDLAPAVAAPGDTFVLHGSGLKQQTASHVVLHSESGPSQDVTGWLAEPRSDASARLELPLSPAAGVPPTPAPGLYQLGVSDAAPGDPETHASRLVPFSIAARIDPGATSLLIPTGGVYHLTGAGFVGGHTELLVGTIPLTEAGGSPPAPGTFVVDPAGTTVDFAAPASLPAGRYSVRLRVNGVESRPAWWVDA
jgi:hypothetical protein